MDENYINKQLKKWKGANATVFEYSVSHQKMTIYLREKGRDGCLRIVAAPVSYFCGRTKWSNANIEVNITDDSPILKKWIVFDKNNEFKIECEGVSLFFN